MFFDTFMKFHNLHNNLPQFLIQDAMLNGRSAIQEEQPRNNQGLFENDFFSFPLGRLEKSPYLIICSIYKFLFATAIHIDFLVEIAARTKLV